MNRLWSPTILVLFSLGNLFAASQEEERLAASSQVFQEIMNMPDGSIPRDLLARASCIGIIPSMKKGAFFIGGHYGKGMVSCRKGSGTGEWGPPAMITVGGGSFGLAIGAAAVDVVMLVMMKEGVYSFLKNKFTLGIDASAAAGPVGRAGAAETDAYMRAKILSYSRSRGVFAGVELKGTVIRQDRDANRKLYQRVIGAKELLMGVGEPIPAAAIPVIQVLTKFSPTKHRRPL